MKRKKKKQWFRVSPLHPPLAPLFDKHENDGKRHVIAPLHQSQINEARASKLRPPEADDCHDTHAPELVRLEPFVRARWKQLSRAFGRCHLGSTNLNIIFLTFHFLPAALISRRADGGRRNVSQVSDRT